MTQVASTVVVQFWKRFTSLSVTIPSKKGEGLVGVVVGMVVAEDVVVPRGVVMDAVDALEVVIYDSSSCTYNKHLQVPGHTLAALSRWEPEIIACEPEAVNRKGLQVTQSIEASSALKNWRQGI
jgi:hypothetical protein